MSLPALDPLRAGTRHSLWYGDELSAADTQTLPTGHADLDAELPGRGWPVGAMTEILLPSPEVHVWQLLLPVLAESSRLRGGPIVLVGAPCQPFMPALAAGGLASRSLMWVCGGGADLWACEQALRCAEVAGVVGWLPRARTSDLRRLQLAAAQHDNLFFICRPSHAAGSSSPARLRLEVSAGEGGRMTVNLLKRRGPPLAGPLSLPSHGASMADLLASSRKRRGRKLQQSVEAMAPASAKASPAPSATVHRIEAHRARAKEGEAHALDRPAMAA